MNKDLMLKIIMLEEEGNVFKTKPYYCSEGYPTYGWGFKIGNKNDPLPAIEITREDGDKKLLSLVDTLIFSLSRNKDTSLAFDNANDARKAIMVSMCYQLGMYGFLKFKKFRQCANVKNWAGAADEMMNSLAARQAPNRFNRQSSVMRTGSAEGVY